MPSRRRAREAAPVRSSGTLGVLRHRDFRLLWFGLVFSAVGTWMQIVAQALLVLELSHGSALALGLVSLAQALAFFAFALFGGAVADRVDKRRLLLVTQTLSMGFAALLGTLALLHVVTVWMVVVLALLQGTALSFDQPARAALVPDLVPTGELFNALSLQSIVFSGASSIGPALAGLSMAAIGYAGNFFVNAASYLLVIGALLAMRHRTSGAPIRTASPRAIREALATVRTDAALPSLILVFGAILFFVPSSAVLLPVMGQQVLSLDAQHIGLLFSAVGVGTVVGGLTLASVRDPPRKALMALVAALLWSFALIGFAISRSFAASVVALFLVGLFQAGVSATTMTLLQTRVPPQMRGRVMSLNTLLIMGVRPLGDFLASAVIVSLGAPFTVIASAALVAVLAVGVATRPAVRAA
jgi:MFS family permease